jgi:signal transduction histidine kinase
VIANLLNNAAKYTEPGGRIELVVAGEQDEIVFRVRDSGIGIARDMLPRIFELFTQIDRSLDRAQGGLGVGLSLVKSVAELHHGTVQAFSEGLGKGSEFLVRLPRLDPNTVDERSQEGSSLRAGRSFSSSTKSNGMTKESGALRGEKTGMTNET